MNDIDHTRGLCGIPDVPQNTPREEVEANPAHCKCCGSEMQIKEPQSVGMQQLDIYMLICPFCSSPNNADKTTKEHPMEHIGDWERYVARKYNLHYSWAPPVEEKGGEGAHFLKGSGRKCPCCGKMRPYKYYIHATCIFCDVACKEGDPEDTCKQSSLFESD